jgi:HAMP domain-containing protein
VYGPADGILNLVYLGLTLTLLMGVLLIIFISGRLTKPLREIRHAMKRVGEGNLDVVVPVRRDDEIAHLAKTFNRMIQRHAGVDPPERGKPAASARAGAEHPAIPDQPAFSVQHA